MKRIFSKAKALSEKAGQIKKALDAAPAQAAQLRQAVLMTADQLHSIRDEVEVAVTGLRATNEEEISHALNELNDQAATIEEAGYEMTGVDMEVSPVQRLIVRLEQFEDVPESKLRLLISSNNSRPTIKALLTAVLKANQISAAVELQYLVYRELIVHLGPMPTVRLAWKVEQEEPVLAPAAAPAPPQPAPAPTPSWDATPQGGFFAPRTQAAIRITPAAETTTSATGAAEPGAIEPAAPASASWQRSALDRFKKMPAVSKYGH